MLSTTKVPNVEFNNGRKCPIFGLGTWNSAPGVVAQAVEDAIIAGYRHIDGAHVYRNEKEVGDAVNKCIADGIIKREDIFLTSKLWNTDHRPERARAAILQTIEHLNTPYLDLYLMHMPCGFQEGDELFPKDADKNHLYSDVDYLDTWREMEQAVDNGLIRSIGISNFNYKQTKRLLENCRIPPVTNQIECHPYLAQKKLSKYLQTVGIVVTAYSSLGSPKRPWATNDDPVLLDDPAVEKLAQKYYKSAAQILIRYQIDRGHIVIPKSVTKSRIIENFDVFDFSLTTEDVEQLNALDCNGRFITMNHSEAHKYYPFHDEY